MYSKLLLKKKHLFLYFEYDLTVFSEIISPINCSFKTPEMDKSKLLPESGSNCNTELKEINVQADVVKQQSEPIPVNASKGTSSLEYDIIKD